MNSVYSSKALFVSSHVHHPGPCSPRNSEQDTKQNVAHSLLCYSKICKALSAFSMYAVVSSVSSAIFHYASVVQRCTMSQFAGEANNQMQSLISVGQPNRLSDFFKRFFIFLKPATKRLLNKAPTTENVAISSSFGSLFLKINCQPATHRIVKRNSCTIIIIY